MSRSPLWKSALFSFVAFAGTLLAIEAASRLFVSGPDVSVRREHENLIRVLGLPDMIDLFEYDADLFWKLRPGVHERRIAGTIGPYPISFTVSTNRLGLRGPPIPKRKSAFRVLAAGNSCTFGIGVDDDETWPALLERRLEETLGREVRVINAGVPGYTAFQGMRYIERDGLDLHPDLVIASFGLNDPAKWSWRSDREIARLLAAGRFESILRRSRAFTGLRRVLAPYGTAGGNGSGVKRARLSPEEFTRTLAEIRSLCAQRKIPVLFLAWPHRSQVEGGEAGPIGYQKLVVAFGGEQAVPVIDLIEPFLRAGPGLYADNIHGSAEGCRVAAEAIAAALEKARVRLGEVTR